MTAQCQTQVRKLTSQHRINKPHNTKQILPAVSAQQHQRHTSQQATNQERKGKLAEEEIKLALPLHNQGMFCVVYPLLNQMVIRLARDKAQGVKCPHLCWDDKLEALAQEWADHLAKKKI